MLPDETIESTFCDCCQQFGGYDLLLVEQSDFRRGTSSPSIKLVHAGVRYLQQGNEVIFPHQSATRPRHFGVRFENVSFQYNQKAGRALRDVDFQIHPGRRVAVIGETGSGKSTLIHLLVRFRDPAAGCIRLIRLGGVDVRNFGESDLRRHISVLAQQPHMFNATLRENLLMARPGAGDDELLDALNAAQLLNFVTALPDGLNTWIGETAKLLSGGQARRVAVARTILHNAPLWVLDEPTEGLDPVTKRKMMTALKERTAGRTLLLITHGLDDLDWMDHIVMLDQGRVMWPREPMKSCSGATHSTHPCICEYPEGGMVKIMLSFKLLLLKSNPTFIPKRVGKSVDNVNTLHGY